MKSLPKRSKLKGNHKVIHYFAYGSNMDMGHFEKRCKEMRWHPVSFQNPRKAKLEGYELRFNYCSTYWKAGAANIMENEKSSIYGLLSEIEESDLETIRKKEGYSEDCTKCYYNEVCVNVEVDGTGVRDVKTYKVSKARETKNYQPPTKCYLDLILSNAIKYQFPSEYRISEVD